MIGIDEKRPFRAVNIAVLTVSDTRGLAEDRSGQVLVERIEEAGHLVADRRIIPDERAEIVATLKGWIADPEIDAVIATGGTGVTGRDVTPEAFHDVYEREIPGFGELFRQLSYDLIGTSTMQSRTTGGVAGGTYLFRAARIARSLQGRLGQNPALPARLSLAPLQPGRADAPVAGDGTKGRCVMLPPEL